MHHKFSISHYKPEPELPAKMRLALHTVICCCVFTTVLPLVKGATGELNTSLKKRFRAWLHSRMKRDLCNSSETTIEQYSDVDVGTPQDRSGEIVSPSSVGLNIRSKRSTSPKLSGCVLVTCSYHDLLHQLYLDNEHRQKEDKAPKKKIGSKGYGRRRRSLPTPLLLLTGRQRRSTEDGQQLCRHGSTSTLA